MPLRKTLSRSPSVTDSRAVRILPLRMRVFLLFSMGVLAVFFYRAYSGGYLFFFLARAELAFSPSSEKKSENTFLDVKSRLESIARIGLLKKNDLEVACGR